MGIRLSRQTILRSSRCWSGGVSTRGLHIGTGFCGRTGSRTSGRFDEDLMRDRVCAEVLVISCEACLPCRPFRPPYAWDAIGEISIRRRGDAKEGEEVERSTDRRVVTAWLLIAKRSASHSRSIRRNINHHNVLQNPGAGIGTRDLLLPKACLAHLPSHSPVVHLVCRWSRASGRSVRYLAQSRICFRSVREPCRSACLERR